jgi:hypothetical protein
MRVVGPVSTASAIQIMSGPLPRSLCRCEVGEGGGGCVFVGFFLLGPVFFFLFKEKFSVIM